MSIKIFESCNECVNRNDDQKCNECLDATIKINFEK